jgi:hypothetical protein
MNDGTKLAIGLGGWFAVALIASDSGAFVGTPGRLPVGLGLAVVVPVVILSWLYRGDGAIWRLGQSVNLSVLTLLHLWRLVGAEFLFEYSHGRLPGGFAFPAGLGDMIVGLTAIPMALALRRNPGGARLWLIVWNVFGLVDLIVAVSLGILYSDGALGFLSGSGPTTRLMQVLPRSMIPTFFLPLFISLHLLAIHRGLTMPTQRSDRDVPVRAGAVAVEQGPGR